MIHYEDFERDRLDPIYDIIAPYSEMEKNERYFLNGMIRFLKPRKILEVGVSSGGGSALILNAISDIDGAELYSVDYSEKAYRHPEKASGFLVEEKFKNLMDKRHIYRGADVSRFIDEVGDDIDLSFLDTVHTHPWETLNFLCVLPFMKNNSWLVLHDIMTYMSPSWRHSLACRYLYASVVSDEKITPVSKGFANIGAFKVSEITRKYVNNLFETLLIPWNIQISERDMKDISSVIEKCYSPEQYKFFCNVLECQDYIFRHPVNMKSKVRHYLQQNTSAKVYSFLYGIRRSLRKLGI